MLDGYLESTLLAACPGLRDGWNAVRRTHAGSPAPSEDELFVHVRLHVVGLLASRRLAEFSRFARAIDRLLADADPLLLDLLHDRLLRPLAHELREAGVSPSLVEPHLGPRLRAAWQP